jgi:hypothetical protein
MIRPAKPDDSYFGGRVCHTSHNPLKFRPCTRLINVNDKTFGVLKYFPKSCTVYITYIYPPTPPTFGHLQHVGNCSAPCLFFYLSNARRFYSSMGKLCSLMGLTIWNTRHTGWQSGNYFVTTVCCFPCTEKVPCILATFDY